MADFNILKAEETIFSNIDSLDPDFVPKILPHREEQQREIEDNVYEQLGFRIDLIFPASLEKDLISDQAKDKTSGVTKPGEMQPTMQQE